MIVVVVIVAMKYYLRQFGGAAYFSSAICPNLYNLLQTMQQAATAASILSIKLQVLRWEVLVVWRAGVMFTKERNFPVPPKSTSSRPQLPPFQNLLLDLREKKK